MDATMVEVGFSQTMDFGYDEPARELIVTFASGMTRVYYAVPPSVYRDLVKSESKGQFFLDNIHNAFPCVHAEGRQPAASTGRGTS
jgi:hypothetical protein